MEVILLERIGKLGQMGDVVRVKDGYARNFLLPRGKALRATADNKSKFEGMKAELQARSLELKGHADTLAAKLDGRTIVVIRQASESGQLFGSVSTRDIAGMLTTEDAAVNRAQVVLNAPIKTIGQYKVPLSLHPEVEFDRHRHRRAQRGRGRAGRARRGRHRAPRPGRGGCGGRPGSRRSLLRAGSGQGIARDGCAGSRACGGGSRRSEKGPQEQERRRTETTETSE